MLTRKKSADNSKRRTAEETSEETTDEDCLEVLGHGNCNLEQSESEEPHEEGDLSALFVSIESVKGNGRSVSGELEGDVQIARREGPIQLDQKRILRQTTQCPEP